MAMSPPVAWPFSRVLGGVGGIGCWPAPSPTCVSVAGVGPATGDMEGEKKV